MLSQWPNGQGVGFRSRRLGVRVPSGMSFFYSAWGHIVFHAFGILRNWWLHSSSLAVEHRSYEPGVAGSIPAWSIPVALVV